MTTVDVLEPRQNGIGVVVLRPRLGHDDGVRVPIGQTRLIEAMVMHSPLVGPSSVRPLAASLRERGWSTIVPDLSGAIESPASFAAAAVDGVGPVEVIIGHSGAGAFIPTVADQTHAAVRVFVDAIVPDCTTGFTPSARFLEFVDAVPIEGGRLAPWHTWWPEDTLAELVPDEQLRRELIADIPRVPRSFYDVHVAVPRSWWTKPSAYLQLSDTYDDERTRVQAWGWPTRTLDGGHLDLYVDPELIADHICELFHHAASSTTS